MKKAPPRSVVVNRLLFLKFLASKNFEIIAERVRKVQRFFWIMAGGEMHA